MKKMTNKLLIVILAMIFFIATNNLVSNAITIIQKNGDRKEIDDDYELADYARGHAEAFVNCNLNEKVGKEIGVHTHDQNGIYTIDLKTVACMYHDQGNGKDNPGTYLICNVIDIEGRHATIYKRNGSVETTTDLIGSMGYALHRLDKSTKTDLENEGRRNWRYFSWKSVFKNIFIKESNGLKDNINRNFLGERNADATNVYTPGQWNNALDKGGEYGNPNNKPEKGSATPKLKNRIHWTF